MKAIKSYITSSFAQEYHRFWLWFPVAVGFGVVSYFGLSFEPLLYTGIVVFIGIMSAWFIFKRHPLSVFLFLLPFGFALGFTAAQFRTHYVAAPKITQDYDARAFKGEVLSFQETAKGPRLVLRPSYIQGLDDEKLPHAIKVIIADHAKGESFVPGDIVRSWGFIKPPLGSAFDGAYDFERHGYFKRIGGVAFALTKPQLIERPDNMAWALKIETLRSNVTEKIYQALPGEGGGIAAALITGHKEKIPEETYDAYRNAGLAHLLAISGLHFGLIFGFIFFVVRIFLVAIPTLALRYPLKKWAIVIALMGAFCYSVLAGGSVPTMRSFIMLGLFSFAVLLDRLALSMYNVAWAALLIMLMIPEAVLGPSFQMSFAAVIALISLYENWVVEERANDAGYVKRAFIYMVMLSGTSLVAGLATMPYTIFHFGQFQPYGVAANLIAIPMAGVWIMPAALLALILMPFGLETIPLYAMGQGIEFVSLVAKGVASWKGAVISAPMFSWTEIGLITTGALWFFIWQRRWRYAGIAPILIALVMLSTHDRPDLFVGGKGKVLAVKTEEGLYVTTVKRQAFTRKQWLVAAGCKSEACFPYSNRKRDDRYAEGIPHLKCDYLGCVARLDGQLIAIPRRNEAFYKDCERADSVLVSSKLKSLCPEKTYVMPEFDAGLGYVTEAGIRWVLPEKGKRPWR